MVLAWIVASAVSYVAQLRLGDVVDSYLIMAWITTLVMVAAWIFAVLVRWFVRKVEYPTARIARRLWYRLPFLLLPALVSPLFLSAYTTSKTGMPFIVGFHWDAALTRLDEAIFFGDPWRITHAALGGFVSEGLVVFYAGWGLVLVFSQAYVALAGCGRIVATFFPAMMLTWLVGGVLFAYALSSAGPALDYAVHPALGHHFAGLVSTLDGTGIINRAQGYLVSRLQERLVYDGGGVSAMPSMHVATTTIYVLAARGTKWFWPAVLFAIVIWVGSIHFGFHYAVDGPVAAAIAFACWHASERLQSWLTANQGIAASVAATSVGS